MTLALTRPLPEEREDHSAASGKIERFQQASYFTRVVGSARGPLRATAQLGRARRILLPLPGGEGRGEGGRV